MSEFVGPFDRSDASLLEQQTNEQLEAKFAGWSPTEGGLATWLVKAFSRISSQVFDQATVLLRGAFQRFGESVVNVPPIQAAPATASSTWTMIDNKGGYEIPVGTQVVVPAGGGEPQGFRTVEDVVVPLEETTVSIPLEAITPGEAGNGLTEDPRLVSGLGFVDSIELDSATADGVDEEDEDAYLDRLTEALQLLSLSLIVPRDFEIDARAVGWVARALCIPAYNGETEEEEGGAVSIVGIDEAGANGSTGNKELLQERQQERVPSGVDVYAIDATYTEIDVEAKVTVLPGFDSATVLAAVKAKLADYLSPANWGLPRAGDVSSTGWENQTTVYLNELISEVDRVAGVGRVASLKLVKGGGALGTADVVLEGVAPLTKPGEIEVSAA